MASAFRSLRGDGMVEYLIVLALFALAAVGAVAIFGDDLRALFGMGPPRAAAPAGGGSARPPGGAARTP